MPGKDGGARVRPQRMEWLGGWRGPADGVSKPAAEGSESGRGGRGQGGQRRDVHGDAEA